MTPDPTDCRQLREGYALMLEAMRDGVWDWDVAAGTVRLSNRYRRMRGEDGAETVTLATWKDWLHPEDRPSVEAHLEAYLAEDPGFFENVHRLRHADGGWRWVRARGAGARDADGRVRRMVCCVADVSDDILAEEQRRELARELTRVNRDLDLILSSAGDGIYRTDLDGRVTFVNATALTMLGFSRDEVVGQSMHDIVHIGPRGRRCPPEECPILAAQRAGERRAITGQCFRRKDGTSFPVDCVVSPVEEGGELDGAVVVFRDATERVAAEQAVREREDLYRQMFDTNTAIKLLIDPHGGVIVDANAAAIEFYGYPREELIGKPITEINVLTPEKVLAEAKRAVEEARLHFRFQHRLASGEIRDVEVFSGPVQVHGKKYLHSIVQDVTERNRLEHQLREQAAELARSNEELEQFAYVASHDLKEPLRMVVSFLQLLQKRYADKLGEEAAEFIGFAVEGAKRMDKLIADLLTYSRIDRRGKPLEPVAMAGIVEAALGNLRLMVADTGAEVEVGDMPTVLADDVQAVSLVQNLLSNAMKYRHPERPPRLRVEAAREGAFWRLSVVDNGLGVEPQYFERIFLIFQRLHTRAEYEGTGIGLAVCKKIVERHGGRIWVESTPGEGSTFHFTLPAG